MSKRDYYEVLGLSKEATDADIKSAFRKLSRKWHPDMQSGKSDSEKKEAEEKFKEIAEAYEVLSDKDKRQSYDTYGFDGGPSGFDGGGMDMGDFMRRHAGMFSGMFGGSPFADFEFDAFGGNRNQQFNPNQPEDGQHIQAVVGISFKESVFGTSKSFVLDNEKACSHCHGTGVERGSSPTECSHCHGTGVFRKQQRTPFGVAITQSSCPYCHGSGTSFKTCKHCNGSRREKHSQEIAVKVPAGISDGSKLRVVGKGQCGVCGGRDGNLYVIVRCEQSEIFRRSGNDIEIDMHVSPITATLGGKIDVPTLSGIKSLTIPAGTATGHAFRIPKQGINGEGSFIVHILVEPLESLTSEQKNSLKALAAQLSDDNVHGAKALKEKAQQFYDEKL